MTIAAFSISPLSNELLGSYSIQLVGFSEASQLNSKQLFGNQPWPETIKSIYSNENRTSLLVGSHQKRWIMISHLNCDGRGCQCIRMAENYLLATDAGGENNQTPNSEWFKSQDKLMKFPYLAVCVSSLSLRIEILSRYSPIDVAVESLPFGCYVIKNCIFSTADSNMSALLDSFHANLDSHNYEDASLLCTNKLIENFQYNPQPKGFGITYYGLIINLGEDIQDKRIHVSTNTNGASGSAKKKMRKADKLSEERSSADSKPPRKLSGYNMFVKSDFVTSLRTDNTAIGELWQGLSDTEKAVYKRQADEANESRQQESVEMSHSDLNESEQYLIEESPTKRKSGGITGYNCFVQHERSYAEAQGMQDRKYAFGKHCGIRWKAMEESEKQCYDIMSDIITSTNTNCLEES